MSRAAFLWEPNSCCLGGCRRGGTRRGARPATGALPAPGRSSPARRSRGEGQAARSRSVCVAPSKIASNCMVGAQLAGPGPVVYLYPVSAGSASALGTGRGALAATGTSRSARGAQGTGGRAAVSWEVSEEEQRGEAVAEPGLLRRRLGDAHGDSPPWRHLASVSLRVKAPFKALSETAAKPSEQLLRIVE